MSPVDVIHCSVCTGVVRVVSKGPRLRKHVSWTTRGTCTGSDSDVSALVREETERLAAATGAEVSR